MATFRTLSGLKKAIKKAIKDNGGFIPYSQFSTAVCGENSKQKLFLTNHYWKLCDEGLFTLKELDVTGWGNVQQCIVLGDRKHVLFMKELNFLKIMNNQLKTK